MGIYINDHTKSMNRKKLDIYTVITNKCAEINQLIICFNFEEFGKVMNRVASNNRELEKKLRRKIVSKTRNRFESINSLRLSIR